MHPGATPGFIPERAWIPVTGAGFLHRNLQQWNDRIGTYRSMLEVREKAYQASAPKVGDKLSGKALQELDNRRQALEQRVQRAQAAEGPVFGLADQREMRLIERLDRLDGLVREIGSRQDLREQEQRVKLLRGTLIWNTVTEHPIRRWELTKQVRELDRSLEQTRKQQAALERAHRETQGRFSSFAGRIGSLEQQIPGLMTKLAETTEALRKLLSALAIDVLDTRKQMLHDYLIQARFGLASLLDRDRGGAAR